MDIPETVVFEGVTYKLMGPKRYYLSQPKTGPKGAKGLHVAIWESHHGKEAPKGYVIHHIDGNPHNNNIENLECVSCSEHRRIHPIKDMEKQIKHLERIRPLAAPWHSSPEGKAWHREHARIVGNREPQKRKCSYCGKCFLSKRVAKYCSNQCGYKGRRAAGYYDRELECVICGEAFKTVFPINPKRVRKTCGQKCKAKLRRRNIERARLQPNS